MFFFLVGVTVSVSEFLFVCAQGGYPSELARIVHILHMSMTTLLNKVLFFTMSFTRYITLQGTYMMYLDVVLLCGCPSVRPFSTRM